MAVAPRRTVDRRQHLRGAHAAEVPQRVLERALLGRDLRRGVEMLQRAAAADAEMRTARLDARRDSACRSPRRARSRRSACASAVVIVTRSPGSAPSTNTALPSMRATPRPSWSSEAMSMRAGSRGERRNWARRSSIGAAGRIVLRRRGTPVLRRRVPRGSSRIARMRILALETSTEWCSVAVGDGDAWQRARRACRADALGTAAAHGARGAGRGRAGRSRELDGLAFGAGPGSFTGIRIGCGVAQGLALGADLPVVAVPTLEALAQSVLRAHGWTKVLACLDARMREVYVAALRA